MALTLPPTDVRVTLVEPGATRANLPECTTRIVEEVRLTRSCGLGNSYQR